MMNDKKLTIFVINYNTIEYTQDCINDLILQSNKEDFDIWVIDQNSDQPGTSEFLSSIEKSGFKVIRNDKNEDLNRVWNSLYENCNSEYLCFLNNDTRISTNFVKDTIKLLDTLSDVGIAIHVTNNPKYIQSEDSLIYEILNPRLFQGWDFTIRKSLYTKIPNELRIFGGDDFLFSNVDKMNYDIGFIYSSPIIHFKEKTRTKIGSEIKRIHRQDTLEYTKIRNEQGLRLLNSTYSTDKCNKIPPGNLKLKNQSNG